jgi:DNA polymerase III delta subunit
MLRVFIGTDFEKRREAVHSLIDSLGEIEEKFLDGDDVTSDVLEELIHSQTLFGAQKVIILSGISGSNDVWKMVSSKFSEMKNSDSLFLISEDTLTAPRIKQLSSKAEKVERFDARVAKKESPKAFKLTDSFLRRDKKEMWIRYHEALRIGEEPEALHGALFWQVKSIALAHEAHSAEEADLNPFVYSKSKAGTRLYSEEETRRIAHELIALYHSSRETGEDLREKLEAWILSFS